MNPFAAVERFDDGVKVSPYLVRLYLSLDEEVRARLQPTAGLREPSSFCAWLIAPAEADPEPGRDPMVTNLAASIHRRRLDLQREFQDPFGRHREPYVDWFLRSAVDEYLLDPALVVPARDSYVAWANGPVPNGTSGPPLTNLALAIHASRPDLQTAFPTLEGRDRIEYVIWYLTQGVTEHQLDDRVVAPLWTSFSAWASEPAGDEGDAMGPSRLARHIHDIERGLQRIFPDPDGGDRAAFATWFATKGQIEYTASRVFGVPPTLDFRTWAVSPTPRDTFPGHAPMLTNLLMAIYDRRPDLQQAMPDVFGADRLDFARWIVRQGEAEYGLTREYLAPFLESVCSGAFAQAAAPGRAESA